MTSDGTSVLGLLYLVPLALAFGVYAFSRRKTEQRSVEALRASESSNLMEPPSLHPAINANRCLGCGACVTACPEEDVLGLVRGKAVLVNPTHCIGHGACETACPFDAITLVLGTERRGVEIPRLRPDFQTAVPGVFVAGELGGMGLIRNAVEQGRQVIESVAALGGMGEGEGYDVVIVGAGPAGLSASLAARERGLRFLTIEQESLGGTVAHYPRGKIVMTSACTLPSYGKIPTGETSKESLLALFSDVVKREKLDVHYQERVDSVRPEGRGFEVKTQRATYRTRAVVLSIGRRGTPAKLGVPGEESSHVVYGLVDPEQYRGQSVLVVGGGDSALEAALSLADEPGTTVVLSYRGESFSRAKPANRARVEAAQAKGRLRALLGSNVVEIGADSTSLKTEKGVEEIDSDAVIVCVGGVLPTAFLHSIGITTETKHGTPLH
jgi:thioredoxin reductase/NAD-dependent dihydropyrimidine dehydrogenase PreA subunit